MLNKKTNYYLAFVLPEFVTEKEAGGLATYYDNVSRLLADSGNYIIIFVLSDVNEDIDYYPGITVKRLHYSLEGINPTIPTSFMRFLSKRINKSIAEYISEGNRIDLIQYANYMGLGFDRLDDIPTVIRLSSFHPYMRAASQLSFDPSAEFLCEKPADFLEMLSVIKADIVYSPSAMLSSMISKMINRDIEIIESPFYPKCLENNVTDFEFPENKKYIITFSTLNLLKGIKLIGDCLKYVFEQNPGLYWVFAGKEVSWKDESGVEVFPVDYMRKKAGKFADRVIYLGKIEHDKLMGVVLNAELCVMPSRIDNLPNACVEAMALGKTVIGTRGASFDQLIEDGVSGFLVDRENGDSLIKTIRVALNLDDNQKRNIGEAAKKRIVRMRSDIIRDQLMTLYNTVIDEFKKPTYQNAKIYKEYKYKYNYSIDKCNSDGAKEYLLS